MTNLGLRRDDVFNYRQVLDFVYAHPAGLPHVIDQPYRLTSYSLEDPRNYAGWVDRGGGLMAFGAMQEPFSELDFAGHPDLAGTGLDVAVLRWGLQRGQAIADAAHLPYTFYVWATPSATAALQQLAPALAPTERRMVIAAIDLTPDRQSPPRLPEGFALRTLAGEADRAAYVTLQRTAFGTRKMTPDWRRRMGETPEYVPDLNVAVVDPQGELAAAAIGWVGPDQIHGQLEPGITHPRYHRMGLMRAVVQELLNRMAARGLRQVTVCWLGANTPVGPLVNSLGFTPLAEYPAYGARLMPRTLRGWVRRLRGRWR